MKIENRYNQRQYTLMKQIIDEFNYSKDNYHLFGSMVERLQALIDCLEDISNDKKNEFWSVWGILEEVYADHENSGIQEFDERDKQLVTFALASFKKIITSVSLELNTKENE